MEQMFCRMAFPHSVMSYGDGQGLQAGKKIDRPSESWSYDQKLDMVSTLFGMEFSREVVVVPPPPSPPGMCQRAGPVQPLH